MSHILKYIVTGQDQLSPMLARSGKNISNHTRNMERAFKGVSIAMAGAGALMIGVLGKAVNDARNLNLAPLKQAATNAGISWADFRTKLDQAGKSMENLGFTNSETNKSLTRLLTTTQDQKVSLAALTTAADLARFKHISLSDAAGLLSRAAAGNTRALKDVGIATNMLPKNFSKTGTSADRLKIILGLMSKRIGGQATTAAKTFGGKMEILKAKITDTSAKIGLALMPMLIKLVDLASKYLVPILHKWGNWMVKTGIPKLKEFGEKVMPKVTNVIGTMVTGVQTLIDIFKKLPGPIKAVIIILGALALAQGDSPHRWGLILFYFRFTLA